MAERTVYGLIPSEDPSAVQHVMSVVSGRSKCGRPIDTTLPIPRDLPVCKTFTRFDVMTGTLRRTLKRVHQTPPS
jgi:hypothetical protein